MIPVFEFVIILDILILVSFMHSISACKKISDTSMYNKYTYNLYTLYIDIYIKYIGEPLANRAKKNSLTISKS